MSASSNEHHRHGAGTSLGSQIGFGMRGTGGDVGSGGDRERESNPLAGMEGMGMGPTDTSGRGLNSPRGGGGGAAGDHQEQHQQHQEHHQEQHLFHVDGQQLLGMMGRAVQHVMGGGARGGGGGGSEGEAAQQLGGGGRGDGGAAGCE